jgi:rod shape-determining protein MreD
MRYWLTYTVIPTSLFISLIMNLAPWPDFILWLAPAWVELCLLYWVIMLPQQVGLFTAGCLGIILDVLNGSLLGLHALALVIIVYFACKYYRQIRMFPLWQQALVIFTLLLIYEAILFWLQAMLVQVHPSHWLTAVSSALLWPLVAAVLGYYRRKMVA